MTENEEIKRIKEQVCNNKFLTFYCDDDCKYSYDGCVYSNGRCKWEKVIQALDEIQEYRAIGTVEELRALKKRNIAKKPTKAKSMMTKREFQICPICERLVLYDDIKFYYCQYCGQKLDWE